MSPPSPPFPDAALRELLARFAAARASSAARSAPSSDDDEGREMATPRFVYVDAFAGAEFAFGTGVARAAEDETRTGAVVRAVGAVADVTANCVFVEEDPAHLQRVYACLERTGAEERVRGTRELATLATGEIALVEAPFRAVADSVGAYTARASRSLAWLAPPSARELPWTVLRAMLAAARGDLLVRLPVTDWEKQARFNTPVSDFPPFARRIVEGCSAMLDDAKHEWLLAWRAAEREGGIASGVATIAARFLRLLEHAAVGRTVRHLHLSPSGDGGPAAHLFLVTLDPLAALELNAAVRAAGLIDRAADPAEALLTSPMEPPPAPEPSVEAAKPAARRKPASRAKPAAEPEPVPEPAPAPKPPPSAPAPVAGEVLDLFGDAPPPAPVDPAIALAERLAREHAGRTIGFRALAAGLERTAASADDLRRALTLLKRAGRAVYKTADDDAPIEFPAEPVVRPAAAPRKRKPRPAEGGLFGDTTDDEEV